MFGVTLFVYFLTGYAFLTLDGQDSKRILIGIEALREKRGVSYFLPETLLIMGFLPRVTFIL